MDKYNPTYSTSSSVCSTSNGIINNLMTSESLKKSNTAIKKPTLFITLKQTPNGYIFANNNMHAKVQYQQNLSTSSSTSTQENSYPQQADDHLQKKDYLMNACGPRHFNEKSNHSKKNGNLHRPKNRTLVLTKKSPLTTALVSDIQTQSKSGNVNYRLTNGNSITSASKQSSVESTVTGLPASNPIPSSLTKFNLPPPPKKNEFKIVTKTQFATAVDLQPVVTKVVLGNAKSETVSSGSTNNSLEFLSNGVPRDCQSFRKVKIGLNNAKPGVHNASESKGYRIPASVHVPRLIPKPATISNSLFDDERSLNDFMIREDDDNPSNLSPTAGRSGDDETPANTLPTAGRNGAVEDLTKRVHNMERGQIASAQQGSEVLIAVKKMAKSLARFVKYADDNNDEIRKLLPIKRYENLIGFDQRIIDESDFRKNVLLYLRGYRGTETPDHFTSVLRKIMTDDLIYDFNLTGIMGKRSLESFKFLDVIHDLYKPMDDETFKAKMRKTLTMSKNRKNSSNFRLRSKPSKQLNMNQFH